MSGPTLRAAIVGYGAMAREHLPFIAASPFARLAAVSKLTRADCANLRNTIMQDGTMHGMPRMLEAVYRASLTDTPSPITPAQMLADAS